jgi:hypothetical protein
MMSQNWSIDFPKPAPHGAAIPKMPFDPSKLDTFTKAQAYLPSQARGRTFEEDVLDFAEKKDYWQNGVRYVGVRPAMGDSVGWNMLRKSFAPILKNRECLKRHRRGVIGREPQFELVLDKVRPKKERKALKPEDGTLTEDEQFADAADKVQGDVWDEKGEHKVAKADVLRLLAIGAAYLRYDIPPGLLVDGIDRNAPMDEGVEGPPEMVKGVASTDWQEVYRMTYMEMCPRGSASVYTDPHTMRKTSFYSYDEEVEGTERSRKCIQVSWVDEEGLTQVRVLKDGATPESWSVDTGGFLLVEEAELEEALVTPDMLRLQDIVCSIGTMVKINTDVAGFPQTDAINMAEPTEMVPDPANPGQFKPVPADLPSGPRITRAFYSDYARDENGKPLLDDNNKPIVLSSAVQYRAPVSSQPLRDDIEFFNTEIYSHYSQRHIPARTSANASAEMLVEMRADYADSLSETKPDVERQFRNVFKGRLCMAAYLAGDKQALERLKAGRVRVDLRLNAGPLSVAEKDALVARYQAGLLARETLIILLGDTDDAEAEIKKIDEEAKTSLTDRAPAPRANLRTVK